LALDRIYPGIGDSSVMKDLNRLAPEGGCGLRAGAEQALNRLLDYYQHTATLAQARLARQTQPGARSGAPPSAILALEDAGQALAWMRADRDSLLACLDHVTRNGQQARVIALTAALAEMLRRDGPWTEAIARHVTAIQAARQLGDQLGEANILTDLGVARQLNGDNRGAARDLEQALTLYRHLDNRLGEANALTRRADVLLQRGDYPGGASDLERALTLYRDLGNRLGEASALVYRGDVLLQKGDYPGAASDLEQALTLYRDLGNRLGQANALMHLGDARLVSGDYLAAARDLEQALCLCRDPDDGMSQANALLSLANAHRLTGDYPGAAVGLQQALTLFRDLGDRHRPGLRPDLARSSAAADR
jgi:tetratricopeptide (TPR) repeat protein